MTSKDWYDSLSKPSWTPEPATIGMIWQIIYPIILIMFGFVFVRAITVSIWRHYKLVAVPQVPYFIWESIATVLQLSITFWNWGK